MDKQLYRYSCGCDVPTSVMEPEEGACYIEGLCPLHAAAPQLLEACRELVAGWAVYDQTLEMPDKEKPNDFAWKWFHKPALQAVEAIEAAEGDPDAKD